MLQVLKGSLYLLDIQAGKHRERHHTGEFMRNARIDVGKHHFETAAEEQLQLHVRTVGSS